MILIIIDDNVLDNFIFHRNKIIKIAIQFYIQVKSSGFIEVDGGVDFSVVVVVSTERSSGFNEILTFFSSNFL